MSLEDFESNIKITTENEADEGEQLKLEEGIDLLKERQLDLEDHDMSVDIGRLDVDHLNKVMFSIDMTNNDVKQLCQLDQSVINNSIMDRGFFEGDSMFEDDSDPNRRVSFNLSNDLIKFEEELNTYANTGGNLALPAKQPQGLQKMSLSTVNTNLVGWVYKQTQYKDGSKALINLVNSMKSSDTRIMTLNEASKTIVFINKGTDTKKIPYADIINIFLAPRNINHDIIIETKDDFVYLDIMAAENGLSNINTVYGWYLAFKSTSLNDKTNYDVYKYKDINVDDLKVFKFSKDKIKTIMQMKPEEKKKVIYELSDKLFDYYKVNETINKNQFIKCIKLISNNIFTQKEIDMIYADLVNRSESSSINEESFITYTSEMINLIIEKLNNPDKK